MSKKKVVVKSDEGTGSTTPTKSKFKKTSAPVGDYTPVFTRDNYLWMFIAIGLVFLGFLLMLGGGMPSPDVWDEGLIYSFRRITLAPLVIVAGFVVGVYSIFK